jgi:hypothetical protein
MSHENELIIATIAALKADATLVGLLSEYAGQPSVFTHVPQDLGESYPWVNIFGVESQQFDNDATLGFDCTMTVHSWSNQRDMAQINNIKKAIYDVLHNNSLTFTGYCNVLFQQEFQTTLRDPDGITLHGVQRFNIIMQEG